MTFTTKYTSEAKKIEVGEDKKIVLSNEQFALIEAIYELVRELGKKRR